jgi:hypothetical protein
MSYICHSGGCPGSDMWWENEGLKYGVKTISYSFWNHHHEGRNPKILSGLELKEGYDAAKKADITLKRGFDRIQHQYVKNLLGRNWFQVKNSEAVFAIGTFVKNTRRLINGGTGWAVQMAIDVKKPVFVFDQTNFESKLIPRWNVFDYESMEFVITPYIPKLPANFAGIGTREINSFGKEAIHDIYKANFASLV